MKYYVLLLTCCSIIHSRLSGYVSTKLKKVWALSSYFRSREKIVDRQTRKNNLDNDRNSENNIIFTRSFNMRSRKHFPRHLQTWQKSGWNLCLCRIFLVSCLRGQFFFMERSFLPLEQLLAPLFYKSL